MVSITNAFGLFQTNNQDRSLFKRVKSQESLFTEGFKTAAYGINKQDNTNEQTTGIKIAKVDINDGDNFFQSIFGKNGNNEIADALRKKYGKDTPLWGKEGLIEKAKSHTMVRHNGQVSPLENPDNIKSGSQLLFGLLKPSSEKSSFKELLKLVADNVLFGGNKITPQNIFAGQAGQVQPDTQVNQTDQSSKTNNAVNTETAQKTTKPSPGQIAAFKEKLQACTQKHADLTRRVADFKSKAAKLPPGERAKFEPEIKELEARLQRSANVIAKQKADFQKLMRG